MKRKRMRMKIRFKKKIYQFLLSVNDYDFSKWKSAVYVLAFCVLLLTACLLPTTYSNNSVSAESSFHMALCQKIRSSISTYSTLSKDADVVVLILPEGSETANEAELLSLLENKNLYSFYLTGEELYFLAESAVAADSRDVTVYLDGLTFTYHKNRLPFDRVTELSFADGTAVSSEGSVLYHIIATDDIFALFHYVSYRSFGLLDFMPKDAEGTLLSDYQESIVTREQTSLTLAAALSFAETFPANSRSSQSASTVTVLGGYNLIALWKSPNILTMIVCLLFFFAVVLLWYAIPRMHRVLLWLRIYAIRRRKRGSMHAYSRKRPLPSGSMY